MAKTFFCIDAHTCGNPVRLIAGGGPLLEGNNIQEKRQHFIKEYDWIRKALMFEPRGHDMMSGSILYPPSEPDHDAAILFIETSGCLPMCGHGTIGSITIGIEKGLITPKIPGQVSLETPAGIVKTTYTMKGEKVNSVKIVNVKSFLEAEGVSVSCMGLGDIKVDIAFGGNFYAIIDPQKDFPGLENYSASQLIQWSRIIRKKLNETGEYIHPEDSRIKGLSHVMWTGKTIDKNATARNAVFYGDKAIDRSPCGTGTSARMAQWYAKGKLLLQQPFIHESIIGSKFTGRIEEETTLAGRTAIIPSIEGWARIYGYNTITVDEENDPYALGFQVI